MNAACNKGRGSSGTELVSTFELKCQRIFFLLPKQTKTIAVSRNHPERGRGWGGGREY